MLIFKPYSIFYSTLINPFSRKFFLCTVLVTALAPTYAQPGVKALPDTRKITIGDPVSLWLEANPGSPAGQVAVAWPSVPDTVNGLEITEKGPIDTLRGQDTFLLRQRLLITAFDSGNYYIPAFAFRFTDPQGNVQQLFTDSILIAVQTIPVDTTQPFKPIKDIIAVNASWLDYWKELLAALLLIGLGAFVGYYFYKNKKNKVPEAPKRVPPEKAHEKALRLLEDLKQKQLWQQGLVKSYYSGLSDIVRNYLDERYGISCMEQTTDELLALLKKQDEGRSELRKARPDLKLILRTADLAKFAKANPKPEEHDACMQAAFNLVQRTQMKTGEGAS